MKSNAVSLVNEIEKQLNKWNERSSFTIKGVKNLSRADLDNIKMYAEQFLKFGSFAGLMEPMGAEKEVLEKFGLVDKRRGLYIF